MPRRVIATAEVQVTSDIERAEAGLQDLTATFRQIGARAERAAERAEVAFFNSSQTIVGGYRSVLRESKKLLDDMEATDAKAKLMAETFRESLRAIQRMSSEDMDAKAVAALRVFKEIYATTRLIEEGLHDDTIAAQRAADAAAEIERRTREAQEAAERLRRAFRDVGREIDLVMAGGIDGLEDDIRDIIRRLEDMGGEFRDIARIGETALDDIFGEFDNDVESATAALFRLERQLRDVADIGDRALEGLDNDARQATEAIEDLGRAAGRADRSIDRIGGVSRRASSDVRGLVTLLGTTGLAYAAQSAARFGLDMTLQLEKSEATFLGLTGSVEGAADMLERMVKFARETPYNLANVTESAAQLLAVGDGFGVTTDNIDEYLTAFGNAITITGGSDEQFIRIVRVLGQMSSTGKVLGQDMNQLAQNLPGYDVWQALADGAGTSVQELRRLQDLGQLDELLTGNEAVQILVEGMDKIPGAAGAMERRMNTLGGAMEKFKETAQLAASEGLEGFSETAQDVLGDPVILRSVEELSYAFGDLLTRALDEVEPELDDLAAAGATFLEALGEWTPVLATIIDGLADFLNLVSPIISAVGKMTDAVLNAEGGLGKLAVAAGLFLAGGPIGIAGGVLLGVSGAMDIFGEDAENAADLARLLAAAQREVNDAMGDGEERILSEAQQLALDTAEKLAEAYPSLVKGMEAFDVTVEELRTSLLALSEGTGEIGPNVAAMLAYFDNPDLGADQFTEQLEQYKSALASTTETIAAETEEQSNLFALAGIEEIESIERRREAYAYQTEQVKSFYEDMMAAEEERLEALAGVTDETIELTEEQTDALRSLLEDQVAEYQDWEAAINESVDGASLSLYDLATATEYNVSEMIDAINEHAALVTDWKSNIVTAAAELATGFGVPQEAAQEFMTVLGELGPEFAPALQGMIDDADNGGTQLKEFFDAVQADSEAMSSSLTDAFDEATGAVPTLAEQLNEGTLTIEDIFQRLPEYLEAAGSDMETAAGLIDISDEMGVVGDEAVRGLVEALDNGTTNVREAAARLAGAAEAAARARLEIRSPSRAMMRVGEFAGDGLVRGMEARIADARAAARKLAQEMVEAAVDELSEQEQALADAAERLVEAAGDALEEAWDRVRDRLETRDLNMAVADAKAELAEAQAELSAAQSLAGAAGARSLADARERVARAERVLARTEAADAAADAVASSRLVDFRRETQDLSSALGQSQSAEIAAIQARIEAATRNLDPAGRAAAEAELEAARERHEAERTALDRRREDEEALLRARLANENEIREASIKAQQDRLRAFERAADDIARSIIDAVESLPDLRRDVRDAQRDVQDAFFDQFESLLGRLDDNLVPLARILGQNAGLTTSEINALIEAALAAIAADRAFEPPSITLASLLASMNSSSIPSSTTSQLAGSTTSSFAGFSGPLVTMPGAIIQDATDADLVAQQVIVAFNATGVTL